MTLLHRRSARRHGFAGFPPVARLRSSGNTIRLALRGATSLVTLGALLGGGAHAQSAWNGTTGDYNADANWSNQAAPIMAGQAAVFGNTGTTTIDVGTPIAPDGWTFDANAQAYALTGAGVSFGGAGIANSSGTSQSIGNDVGGAGGLRQTGAGSLTLTGANDYTGATVVTDGKLIAASDGAFSAASAYTVNGGTLQVDGVYATVGSLAGTGGALLISQGNLSIGSDNTSTTFAGTVNGVNNAAVSGLTKVGTGALTLTGGNAAGDTPFLTDVQAGTLVLSNGYSTAALTVAGGATLRVGADGGVNANNVTLYDNGVFDLNGFNVTVGSLASLATAGSTPTSSPPSTAASIVLGAGNLTILGNNGPNIGGVNENDFAGVVSGSGGVILTGGSAGLSGANTFTGGTILSGGTLTVGSTAPAPTGSTITPLGAGVLTLDGGTLRAGGTYTLANGVAVNAAGGAIDVNGANLLSLSGVIADGNAATGKLSILDSTGSGQGGVQLTAANTFSGGVTVNDASVFADASLTQGAAGSVISSSLGTGAVFLENGRLSTISSGTIANAIVLGPSGPGVLDSNGFNLQVTGTIGNAPGGVGVLFIDGVNGGTTVLSGANTYTGGTVLQAGVLQLGADSVIANGAIGSSSVGTGLVELAGGTLQSGGTRTLYNAIAIDSSGGTIDANGATLTLNGSVADGSGAGGVLTVTSGAGVPGTVILSGASSYTGATLISAPARLQAGATNALSGVSDFTVAGTLDLAGFSNTIGSLAGAGPVTLGSGTLTVGDGVNTTFSGSITGTGGLTKQGMDTLTLQGTNTYTGSTTIASGVLLAGVTNAYSATSATSVATGGVLDLGGFAQTIDAVALNGGTLQTGALTGAVTSTGGAIADLSGTAGVTTTSGTTVLAGTNSYTGATAIDGGATIANNANAYSATSATSVATGGTLDLGGFAQTLLSLSGAGRVTNSGPLDALLTIADTTDGTDLFSGTITDGAKGRTALNIAEGTQYLAGTNTYTGGTMIAAQGALIIGNGGSTGSVVGDIANSGVLAFNRSDGASYTGTISGSGSVYQIGIGTTILTADNTYTGGTNIIAGTLQLGSGGTSGSVRGDIANSGTLTFDRSDTVTFANVISGSGTVVQNGTGTTVLSGANVYTGDTLVANGTLTVDGSIRSATTVGSGATLDGNGSVGDVTVGAGGTLGAGSGTSIGLLSINGNVVFQQGSAYSVKILPANQNDILLVSGQANLAGGTVRVLAGGTGYASATRYLILNAQNGIESAFAGVTTNLAFLKPTLLYDANNVFLDVGNPLFTSLTGTTPTEAAVAQALQSGYAAIGDTGNGLLNAVAGLSAEQAPAALAQLSGQATTATQVVSFEAGKQFMAAIDDQSQSWLRGDRARSNANEIVLEAKPMAYAPSISAQAANAFVALDAKEVVPLTRTWRAWGTGYTNAQTLKGLDDGGLLDLSQRTSGGGFGADYQVNPQLLVGFGVGGSTSTFSVPNSLTSGRLEGAHAGLYAAGRFSDFYTTAGLTYAHFDNTTNRLITDVGPRTTEHGHFGSDQIGGSFEAGYRKSMGGFTISPFASVAFYDTFQSGYSETGMYNMAGLTFGARDASSVPLIVGAQIDGRIALGHGMVFEPYLRASYTHETIRHRSVDAFFTSVPLSFFTANGIVSDEDTADVKLGGRLFITPTTSLYASFDGVASSRSRGYSAMGGINFVSDAKATIASASINSVPSTPFTSSVTPDIRIDSFRSSRGYPAVSGPYGGRGSQVYASSVLQTSGTILPDTRLDLLAKPGVVYGRQGSAGLQGSVGTPADTTASATFTYLAINGVQPFLSMNFNLPSGRTVLKGSAANARLDPDFVSVGTYGEGFNIGPTLGVNLPFSEKLTASLSVGYTHHGAYEKEGPIDPVTFAQGTQLFTPGQDITFSANIGYVAAPFSTQASFSFAKQGITSTDGSPTFQVGDRFIGSLSEAYSWSPTSTTNFTGTLVYSERNNILDTSLPAFIAEAFDSNNLVARLRLEHSFVTGKWIYGPVAGFVYRDRNGYDSFTAQFVPAKDIYLGGLSAAYAISEKASAKASIEYFHAIEANNPAANVGTVHTDGFHLGLVGSYVF